jgi:hypothetical protein
MSFVVEGEGEGGTDVDVEDGETTGIDEDEGRGLVFVSAAFLISSWEGLDSSMAGVLLGVGVSAEGRGLVFVSEVVVVGVVGVDGVIGAAMDAAMVGEL